MNESLPCGRLNVELRMFGVLGIVWSMVLIQTVLWAGIALGPRVDLATIPWAWLLLPQGFALLALLAHVLSRLPAARWQRRGSLVRMPTAVPLVVLGFPALAAAPLLIFRDFRLQRQGTSWTPTEVEAAFQSLLRLPMTAGLAFLLWVGLALLADAIVLGLYLDWPRSFTAALAILWMSLLGPAAAIVNSRLRAILRPEYLTAPRPVGLPFSRVTSLRLRLLVSSSIACVGTVSAALSAVTVWSATTARDHELDRGEALAGRMIELEHAGRGDELGRVLVAHPEVGMILGGARYGRSPPTIPDTDGPWDDDGDGFFDRVVARTEGIVVSIPIVTRPPIPLELALVAGILCLVAAVGSTVLVTRDVHRDVVRATDQVAIVARGEAPPPLTEGSFSTREIRQLVHSVDRLVARIVEGNVAKYIAIETAVEADRLKNQFLANMSHDLRSPLNSILGFSELLLTGIDGEITAEQREMVQSIHFGGRTLLQQIDDILDTAKIEAGRMELHSEPTPPATLVSRAIQNARRRRASSIEYASTVAPGLPPAFVDPFRTVQALENVLLFASERMESGLIEISVRQGHGRGRTIFIEIRTPVRPASSEQLRRALKGFYRIPGHRGLGLGLPIAGAILELQSGSLGIEDRGEGMVFTVTLPAPEAKRPLRLGAIEA